MSIDVNKEVRRSTFLIDTLGAPVFSRHYFYATVVVSLFVYDTVQQ